MSRMYRTIIDEEIQSDSFKNEYDLMREVYSHTENKVDVIRNMLAQIYVKDPLKFKQEN